MDFMTELATRLLALPPRDWPPTVTQTLRTELVSRDAWPVWEAADGPTRVELLTDLLYQFPEPIAVDTAAKTGCYPTFLRGLHERLVEIHGEKQRPTLRHRINRLLHAQLVEADDISLPPDV